MQVRPAAAADRSALAGLMATMGYGVDADVVGDRLDDLPDGHAVLVADVDERVVGWIHIYVDQSLIVGRRGQLGGLSVDAASQGQGVATALLDAAEAWARGQGCRVLNVRSGTARGTAHDFYRARGYRDVKQQLVLVKDL